MTGSLLTILRRLLRARVQISAAERAAPETNRQRRSVVYLLLSVGKVRSGRLRSNGVLLQFQKRPSGLEPNDKVFVALDGMRGVAAVMVAIRHAPFLWLIPGTPESFMKNSYLAVDLFFVLSGFVLEYAYGQRLRAGMSVRKFMSARFQRLYPLYVLAFLLALPNLAFKIMTGAVTAKHATLEIVCGSMMLPTPNWGYPHADLYPLNFAAWSLFFELLANMVFALISPHLTNKVLGGIILLTGCAIAVLTPLGLLAAKPQTGALGGGPSFDHFDAGLLRVGFSFFVGVAVYRLHSKTSVRFGSPTAAIVFAATIAALASGFSGYSDAIFDLALVLFLFPLLIFICASVEIEGGRFFQLTKFLGLLSYGIYVLQIPIYSLITYAAKLIRFDSFLIGLLAVIVVIIVAHLATTRVDIPARRWLKRQSQFKSKSRPA